MHIAMISWLGGKPIPVTGYGGIERFVENMCLGLVDLGHTVSLIAPNGSYSFHEAVDIIPCNDMVEAANIVAVIKPDVVHDNTCWSLSSPVRQGLKAPFLSTSHVNHAIQWTKNVVYLSESQRTHHGIQTERNLNFSPVVRVPFDPRFQPHHYDPDSDYCMYIGAIAEWKGVTDAAKLSQKIGKRLVVAGSMSGPYADQVLSYPNVKYIGEVDGLRKEETMAGAYAIMCLHNSYGGWEEPGCGVVGEANALNVPVFAFPNGCLPELIENGVNGWCADTLDQLVHLSQHTHPDSLRPREYAEQHWSLKAIASQYVGLYQEVMKGTVWG